MLVLPSFKSTFSSLAEVESLGRQDHSTFCTQSNPAATAVFDPLSTSFRTHSSSATPSSHEQNSAHSATLSRSTSSRPDIPLLPLDQISGEAPTFGFQSRPTPRRSLAPLPIDVDGLGFCVTGNPYLSSTLRSLKRPSSPQSQVPALKRSRPSVKPSPRPCAPPVTSTTYPDVNRPAHPDSRNDVPPNPLASVAVKVVEDSKGRAPAEVLSIPAQRSLLSVLSARPVSGRSASIAGAISIVHGPTRSDLSHLLAGNRKSPVASSDLVDGTDALNTAPVEKDSLELPPNDNNINSATVPSITETTTTTRTRIPSLSDSPASPDEAPLTKELQCSLGVSAATRNKVEPEQIPCPDLETSVIPHRDSDNSIKVTDDTDPTLDTKLPDANEDALAQDAIFRDGLVKCPICPKKLRNNVTLQNHIKVVHDNNGNFKCRQCDLTFMWRSTLGNHIRLVHEKQRPHACDECGKAFRWKSHLREHIWVVHKGEKPFKCEHCGKTFGRKNNMQKHMRKHDDPIA